MANLNILSQRYASPEINELFSELVKNIMSCCVLCDSLDCPEVMDEVRKNEGCTTLISVFQGFR